MFTSPKNLEATSQNLLARAKQDGIEMNSVRVLIRDGDSILLLRRVKTGSFPDYYELPGGGLDENEDIFSGAERELSEETNLNIERFVAQLDSLDFQTRDNRKSRQYIFIVLVKKGSVILNPKEHYEYKWASISDINTLMILPNTRTILQEVLLSNRR